MSTAPGLTDANANTKSVATSTIFMIYIIIVNLSINIKSYILYYQNKKCLYS